MATHYRTKARIKASPARVWEVLTDVERMPVWTTSMESVRIVDGPFGPGAKVEIRQPRMKALTWTVDAVEPLRHFRWTAVNTGVVTHGDHWLTPDGDHVVVELAISHTGWLARLVGALTLRQTARYVDLELEGLKAASESGAPAPRE